MIDQSSNKEKVPDPKHLRLGWIIREEIGTCVIDPSLLSRFPTEYPAEFISCEDFEPYEVETDDFEEFIPYHIEDD